MRGSDGSGDGGGRGSGVSKGCLGCAAVTALAFFACFAYGVFWFWRHEQRLEESRRYFLEKGKKVGKLVGDFLAPTMTEDRALLGRWLGEAAGTGPPKGYALAGGFSWFLFGKGLRVVSVLPEGQTFASAMRCVEKTDGSGKKKVVLTMGTKTAFLVCQLFKDKAEDVDAFVEDLIRKGEKERDPQVLSRELLEVDVGGRKAKAAMQVFVREGKVLRSVIVGLKTNAVLAAYGPDKGFDETAFLAFCRSVRLDAAPSSSPSSRTSGP